MKSAKSQKSIKSVLRHKRSLLRDFRLLAGMIPSKTGDMKKLNKHEAFRGSFFKKKFKWDLTSCRQFWAKKFR